MKNVPNFITCLNLFAGCLACILALRFDSYLGALAFIVLAAIFDFLDGLSARLLKSCSNTGKELDSLADVISFGLAPGCIVYVYLDHLSYTMGIPPLAFFAFALPAFAALRLAKFNVDTRQTTSFLGLPVPANSLFWASFIPSLHYYVAVPPALLVAAVLACLSVACWLMVSEVPMFSLKFKSLEWKANRWAYTLILLSLLLLGVSALLAMPLAGISLSVVAYIALSVIKNKKG
ncbi:MAG: CDP-diacylglycerol--serine O-phosphatidyltransferase [Dysgonamonadaceae bacterium]|jgi:CDP-diacylglycerol--serine O-phosphatidyltransferase|nr:CDP-diacylglycerol--serine O-phosphatidyltransferase [Dysgonamonadaceae bacterium]